MQIGAIIRKYRKEKNLTQEEIGQTANKITERLQAESYEVVFTEAIEIIREYPNCELLIFTVAQILDSYRVIGEVTDFEKYEGEIIALYKRALQSQDVNIKHGAIIALFNKCLEKEEYEKAQDYLNQIEKQQTNPDIYQALLYVRQGKAEEAYELYERLIFGGFSELSWALNGLYRLSVKAKDFEEAEYLVEKQQKLAEILEMGDYSAISPRMCLALDKKNKEACFEIAEKLIDSIKVSDTFKESNLYRHMKFKKGANMEMMAQMLRRGFEKDKEIDFLRDDPRFQKLIKKL